MSNAPRYRLVGYDIGTAPDENGGWVHWTDHEAEIARLAAGRDAAQSDAESWARKCAAADEMLDAALVGAVKAKPLVWETVARSYPALHARSLGLVYEASCDPDMGWAWAQGDGLVDFAEAANEEAAKSAAQADYEARILAAIQPDPEAHQAALAGAVKVTAALAARDAAMLARGMREDLTFDGADWFWRVMDPDDNGDNPSEAITRGYIGQFTVCEIACSYRGPTRFGFNAPALDHESDEDEFLHFETQQEAIDAAKDRRAAILARAAEIEKGAK